MTNIVFVKTRYHYDSYTDFWRLVELSGFPTCYVDEVDVSKDITYIVSPMNGEWRPHIGNQISKTRCANLILWNLERPSGSGGIGAYTKQNRQLIYGRYIDEVWVSDRRLAQESGAKFVVLGSDYGLAEPFDPNHVKRYDVVHMSYVTHRRGAIYGLLPPATVAPNCWPPERHEILLSSRFALNIHQDQYPFQEPLRLALFAAYGLPILTESTYDLYPWAHDCIVCNPYDGMIGRLRQMLEDDYGRWREWGLRARDYMCDKFNFKDMVLAATTSFRCDGDRVRIDYLG